METLASISVFEKRFSRVSFQVNRFNRVNHFLFSTYTHIV